MERVLAGVNGIVRQIRPLEIVRHSPGTGKSGLEVTVGQQIVRRIGIGTSDQTNVVNEGIADIFQVDVQHGARGLAGDHGPLPSGSRSISTGSPVADTTGIPGGVDQLE